MKTARIAYSSAQLSKRADQLGVLPTTPPELVTKPYGMRQIVFDRRLKSYAKHQKWTVDMVREGAQAWHDRVYKMHCLTR